MSNATAAAISVAYTTGALATLFFVDEKPIKGGAVTIIGGLIAFALVHFT